MELQISPVWFDDDTMMKVRVQLLGNGRQAWHEGYAYPESFSAFGRALMEYPINVSDEVKLELGCDERSCGGYLLIRAFVHDGAGHCALEFRSETGGGALEASSVRFVVPTEAASLNNLGQRLVEWATRPSEAFRFEGTGA
ncbi:MAG: hypothetical protein ACTHL8_16995 [Burkholderiaceae bacterium]